MPDFEVNRLSLESASIHEAGHAVVGVAMGATVERMCVFFRDGHWQGQTEYLEPLFGYESAIAAHAGWKAELLLCQEFIDCGERASDIEVAFASLQAISATAHNPRCMERASELVETYAEAIRSLARDLAIEQEFGCDDLRERLGEVAAEPPGIS